MSRILISHVYGYVRDFHNNYFEPLYTYINEYIVHKCMERHLFLLCSIIVVETYEKLPTHTWI